MTQPFHSFVNTQKNWKQELKTNTCSWVFVAALFAITERRKQPNCLSVDKWVSKIPYIHAMEYYSVTPKPYQGPDTHWDMGELLEHATERSHSQKDTYHRIPFMGTLRTGNSILPTTARGLGLQRGQVLSPPKNPTALTVNPNRLHITLSRSGSCQPHTSHQSFGFSSWSHWLWLPAQLKSHLVKDFFSTYGF